MGHTLNHNNFKSTTFQRPNLIEPTSWRVPKAMSLTHVDYTGSLLTCSRTNGLTILNKCLSFPFFSINYSYSTVRTFFFFYQMSNIITLAHLITSQLNRRFFRDCSFGGSLFCPKPSITFWMKLKLLIMPFGYFKFKA